MNLNEMNNAFDLIENLRSHGWDPLEIPVDVEKIAALYGVTIDSNFEPRFLEKLAAVEGKRIWINPIDPNEYTALRRHIVAHELGHIVLHSPADQPLHFTDTTTTLRGYALNLPSDKKAVEVAANEFAAELLLPIEKVKSFLNGKPGMFDLETDQILKKIAEHFDVPMSLVRLRFQLMGRKPANGSPKTYD
jgi:hypothetical protein